METIKVRALTRELSECSLEMREEGGATRLYLSASSMRPVQRIFGNEVLSHETSAVRLERAHIGAMPMLFNHDASDPIGMVERASIAGGKLIVEAHLFETARGKEVAQMIRGGLKNTSLGYRLHSVSDPDKDGTVVVRDWEPFEVSIVPVPADPSVGIGREIGEEEFEVRIERASIPAQAKTTEVISMADGNEAAPVVNGEQNSATLERLRIQTITKLCDQHKIDASAKDSWISDGVSIDEAGRKVLDVLAERGKNNPSTSLGHVGLSSREVKEYSLFRAVNAVLNKNWNKAGLEFEAHQEIQKRTNGNINENTFYVPLEVQSRTMAKRDLTVATTTAGGFLVATDNVGFLEILRNTSVAFRMGAFRLSGLRDSVTIPKRTVAATTTWLANEASTITESTPTFAQIALTPKTVGAYNEISRQLLLQSSPSAEQLVMSDLAAVVALAVDTGTLNGSGASGQPTGIIGTAGIGSVTGTSIAYAGIVEFQTDTAGGNALFDTSGYVTTPAVAGLLKQRVKFTSTASPIWEGRLLEGSVDGYRAMASNQMPSANILFGDFNQVIVAEWGVLAVEANPYANFQAGIVGIRAMYTVDVAVRYPAAFSLATSVT